MSPELLARGLVGLIPVLVFLATLVYLDSYKLVSLKVVLAIIVTGGVAAGASYLVNGELLEALQIPFIQFSRYLAPAIEETIKGLVIVWLIRTHRIGFLVDAAILGFAAGAGFAMVENVVYLNTRPDAHIAVWIVRGFGTAIMHGGATVIFAITAHALADRREAAPFHLFVPGLLVAVLVHSVYNHFFLSPIPSALLILILLPALIYVIYGQSLKAVENWLDVGFDADTELLELINSGELSNSKVGVFLHSLTRKFDGEVVVDLLCYLRLHVELALRAKGVLMMRENGFQSEVDPETKAKLVEMKYLEKSIGKTGRLAIKPFLHVSRKDLWQLYVLGK
jgi:RsiW-degrading membrane proteinase PrsW (M82 family)